jgi:hypothetical protein
MVFLSEKCGWACSHHALTHLLTNKNRLPAADGCASFPGAWITHARQGIVRRPSEGDAAFAQIL